MTTKFTKNVSRETNFQYQGKNLVVELTSQGVTLRLAGQRKNNAVFAGYQAIYEMACKLESRVETNVKRSVSRGLLKVGG